MSIRFSKDQIQPKDYITLPTLQSTATWSLLYRNCGKGLRSPSPTAFIHVSKSLLVGAETIKARDMCAAILHPNPAPTEANGRFSFHFSDRIGLLFCIIF